ncbi:winged helix-turn-helix transcriptional regulator [Actinacidiphila acididurans]|uniref:Helix-turn-helix transcriptional regulator n=1 Tax=Actinacidiphila acididurans TaxID=2784346 RepID=A0ABS2TUN8_9ACTN|nr:helix-turn-helix domain-containing protein [Actinacidiphila acididurans]MBM9506216.1 helix-turn-helix transcriptional regulator [Actinacidiphila acididurans]
MKRRTFGQYCGLARAMELVGERWAMLIIRDLTVRPQRYTDLLDGLPGIPTNVLSTRLKELEEAGIVERRIAAAPQRGVLYALTAAGRDLEPAVSALGRWGVTQLGDLRPGEIVTPSAVVMALRASFNPAAAAGLTASWEIHANDIVVHAAVTDGRLAPGVGPAPDHPDLVITLETDDPPAYPALMQAATCGLVALDGPRELLDTFIQVFTRPKAEAAVIPGAPAA